MKHQNHYDQGYQAAKNGDTRALTDAVLELPPHHYREFAQGFTAAQNAEEFA